MLGRVSVVVLVSMAGLTVAVADRVAAQRQPKIDVYKSATCGCCGKWVEHLRANGFAVTSTDVEDMDAVKTKYKVPAEAQSCHTAVVDGYVIEGHVPAPEIQRLLKERPTVVGVAAPGMPAGSPGMDIPNSPPYDVVAFDQQGRIRVFSTQRPK